jgi:hypothetical protein
VSIGREPWQGSGTTFMTIARPGYVTAAPYGTRAEFLPSARTPEFRTGTNCPTTHPC